MRIVAHKTPCGGNNKKQHHHHTNTSTPNNKKNRRNHKANHLAAHTTSHLPGATTKRSITTKIIKKYKTSVLTTEEQNAYGLPPTNFNDFQHNLRHTKTGHLIFSNAILTACRIKPFVQNAEPLLHLGRKVLGDKLLEGIVKNTFFKHFCAGETIEEVSKNMFADNLRGVDHCLDYGAEANEFADALTTAPTGPTVQALQTATTTSPTTTSTMDNNDPTATDTANTSRKKVLITTTTASQSSMQEAQPPAEQKSGGCGTGCCGGGCGGGGGAKFDLDAAKVDAMDVFGFDTKTSHKPKQYSTTTETPSKYSKQEDKLLNQQVKLFQDTVVTLAGHKQKIRNVLQNEAERAKYTPQQLEQLAKVADQPAFMAIKLTALAPVEFLSRTNNACNVHSFLWDAMQGRKTHRPTHYPNTAELLAPENEDKTLFEQHPNVLEDVYDTMTREQFTKQIQHFYSLTLDDANELYDQLATRPNLEITRYDWQYNINIHHLITLSTKLSQSRIPAQPQNAKDLLYAYPTLPNKQHDQVFGNTMIDQDDVLYLQKVMKRCDMIMEDAKKHNISVFVDAEQTYYQRVIDHITMDLMSVYNKVENLPTKEGYNTKQYIDKPFSQALQDQRENDLALVNNPRPFHIPNNNNNNTNAEVRNPTVWNTYQCYLKDTPYRIRADSEFAKNNDFVFACKIVRGAYLDGEAVASKAGGYTYPIEPSMENTNLNYNAIMLFLLSQRNQSLAPTQFLIASHNQESLEIATNYLDAEHLITQKELEAKTGAKPPKLPKRLQKVCFAQLKGMLSMLTSALTNQGYSTYTYTPYGRVFEVLPYLLRRSQENSNLFGASAKESKLVTREIIRRLTNMGGKKD